MPTIVQADIFKLRYTLPGYKLSYGTITEVFPVLLKLTDDTGTVGWGEANPQQPFTRESADDVVQSLRSDLLPLVMAEESIDARHIDTVLDRIEPDEHLIAKGAISIAMLDIQGKRSDVGVSDLLGGALRDRIQVSHPLNNGTVADDIAVIDQQMEHGYVDFMLKMGSSPIPQEIQRVLTLENRYGTRVRFKADANTGWTREQAAEFLTGVAGSQLEYVEEPVAKGDIDGMALLSRITTLPISADESLTGFGTAQEIVHKNAAQVFSIKISKNGGPLRSQKIARFGAEHGIKCYANSMLEGGITQAASLHLAATLPNLLNIGHSFRSVLRLDGDVTDFASQLRGGLVHLPQGPGLGIHVDEARVRTTAITSVTLPSRQTNPCLPNRVS